MIGVKEAQCSNCGHLIVCSLKNTFLQAQKAVDDIVICSSEDDGVIRIGDNEGFTVTVKCNHYIPNTRTR